MSDKELIDYINNSLTAGVSSEKIKTELIALGYKEEEVDPILNKLVYTLGVNNPFSGFEIKSFNTKDEVSSQIELEQTYASDKYYLLWALVFQLVGFGTCISAIDGGVSIIYFILCITSYLLSAYCSFMAMSSIGRINKDTGLKANIFIRVFVKIITGILILLSVIGCFIFFGMIILF